MKFPYVEFLGLAEERIFRPLIPITFKVNDRVFESYALIDSGSDYTVLPIEIAGKLGLELSHYLKYNIEGAGGNSFAIYRSPVEIECLLQQRGSKTIRWLSHVYFAESGTTLLLGQKGFLDQFQVKLNGPKREIQILKKG